MLAFRRDFLLWFICIIFSNVFSQPGIENNSITPVRVLTAKKSDIHFAPSGGNGRFRYYSDILFFDENMGWIVGSNGWILFTRDGGRNWSRKKTPTDADLRTITAARPDNIWAAGDDGVILHWDGIRWKRQHEEAGIHISDITHRNDDFALAVAMQQVLVTNDGGEHWVLRASSRHECLTGVSTAADSTHWLWGSDRNGTPVLQHMDGARLHSHGKNLFLSEIQALTFPESGNMWIVCADNTLMHSSDNGETWERSRITLPGDRIRKIQFTDSEHGWFLTEKGHVFCSTNGGRAWRHCYQSHVELMNLFFVNANIGWVVGQNNLILKTSDGGLNWQHQAFQQPLYLSYFHGAYCLIAQKTVERAHMRMHIPVITHDSSPLFLILDTGKKDARIRGSRILHRELDNELLEVEVGPLAKGDSVFIPFDCWTLKQRNQYEDLPDYVDVSRLQDISAEVRKYLASSPLSQSSRYRIVSRAQKLAGNELNLRQVVADVVNYTSHEIEYAGGVEQDAINVLAKKQAVCHGKANLAVALLRALNIPARSLMVANTHYIIEYFVPEYGWVRAESTSGQAALPAEKNTVLWVSTPTDETLSPYNGLICYWGVSEPEMAFDILYDEAQLEEMSYGMDIRPRAAAELLRRAQAVWRLQNAVTNQNTTDGNRHEIQKARTYQWQAVQAFQKNNPKKFIRNLDAAREIYRKIEREEKKTSYRRRNGLDVEPGFVARNEKFNIGNLRQLYFEWHY